MTAPLKLVIVDQSLKDFRGHHYEYAVSVGKAAEARGLEVIVLCHRDLDPRLREGNHWTWIPTFSQSWDLSSQQNLDSNLGLPLPVKAFARAAVTELHGLARRGHESLLALACESDPAWKFYQGLRAWSRRRGFGRPATERQDASFDSQAPLSSNSNSKNRWTAEATGETGGQSTGQATENPFGRELLAASASLDMSEQDHVFVPTLSLDEFASVAEASSAPLVGHWHFLFRRDLKESIFFNRNRSHSDSRVAEALRWAQAQGVHFYTDTVELARDYRQWVAAVLGFQGGTKTSTPEFRVLPIPFRSQWIDEAETRKKPHEEILVTCLGDPRIEKGFLLLPPLAEALKGTGARLVVQTVAPDRRSGLEGPVRRAHERLELSGGIDWVCGPLDPARYYDLLVAADVVVLPYLPWYYRARSSGVLAEAFSAGKPVVVPAGTWLSAQRSDESVQTFSGPSGWTSAVVGLVQKDRLRAATQCSLEQRESWRKFHSPAALVDSVLSSGRVDEGST